MNAPYEPPTEMYVNVDEALAEPGRARWLYLRGGVHDQPADATGLDRLASLIALEQLQLSGIRLGTVPPAV